MGTHVAGLLIGYVVYQYEVNGARDRSTGEKYKANIVEFAPLVTACEGKGFVEIPENADVVGVLPLPARQRLT